MSVDRLTCIGIVGMLVVIGLMVAGSKGESN